MRIVFTGHFTILDGVFQPNFRNQYQNPHKYCLDDYAMDEYRL